MASEGSVAGAIPADYLVFLVAAPIVFGALYFAFIAHTRFVRKDSIQVWLSAFLFCTMGYLLFNFFELVAASPEWTIVWARSMYPFFVFLPSLWLIFIVRILSGERAVPTALYPVILTIPLLTLVVVFIGPWRFLIWSEVAFRNVGPFTVMKVTHGVVFWIYAAHTYLVALAGVIFFVVKFRFRNRTYAFNSWFVILGIAVPLAASVGFVFGVIPGMEKDFTPIAYGIAGLAFSYGVSRKRLFSIVPFARSIIVEQIRDAIIVLDRDDRVVDLNQAARLLFPGAGEPVGLPIADVAGYPADVKKAARSGREREILVRPVDDPAAANGNASASDRWFLCTPSRLHRSGRQVGTLLVLRETTESHLLLKRIEEQAYTDELTGICNRRHFLSSAEKYFSMSKRHSAPLALAMIDIDRFKNVNDTCGHQAGDAVIVAISRMISSRLRKEDIFARFGGDEFAILLPGTGIDTARDLCELFRQQVAENPVALPDGQSCPVTLSIGIAERASGTGSLIELNAAADKALYLSKEMGRNRVSRYPMEQE